jgi:hypothetical protein
VSFAIQLSFVHHSAGTSAVRSRIENNGLDHLLVWSGSGIPVKCILLLALFFKKLTGKFFYFGFDDFSH